MQLINEFNVDLNKPFLEEVWAKQGDNVRYLKFNVFKNGEPFPVSGKVKLYAKPVGDKFTIYREFTKIGTNVIQVALAGELVASARDLEVEIAFYNETGGEVLSTFNFILEVKKSVREQNIKPVGDAVVQKIIFKKDNVTVVALDSNGGKTTYELNKRNSEGKGSIINLDTGRKVELEWEG